MVPSRCATELVPLRPVLECLLFVAADPVTPDQVARALALEIEVAVSALEDLRENYQGTGGLYVARVAGGYQLRTRPEYAEFVARFLQPDPHRLSRQAVETLAVIAYRQPITLPEIDGLRGVSSSGVLKTLLDRGLIRESGRKDSPGRPILYQTTTEFLKHFGLADLSELPSLDKSSLPADVEAERQAA